jgi:hypothetical protein
MSALATAVAHEVGFLSEAVPAALVHWFDQPECARCGQLRDLLYSGQAPPDLAEAFEEGAAACLTRPDREPPATVRPLLQLLQREQPSAPVAIIAAAWGDRSNTLWRHVQLPQSKKATTSRKRDVIIFDVGRVQEYGL